MRLLPATLLGLLSVVSAVPAWAGIIVDLPLIGDYAQESHGANRHTFTAADIAAMTDGLDVTGYTFSSVAENLPGFPTRGVESRFVFDISAFDIAGISEIEFTWRGKFTWQSGVRLENPFTQVWFQRYIGSAVDERLQF